MLHDQRILEARDGDAEAMIWLVREFRESFRRKPHQSTARADWSEFPSLRDDAILDFFVKCFDTLFDTEDRLIKGKTVGDAFRPERPRRGPTSKRLINMRLGSEVQQRYAVEQKLMDESEQKGAPLQRAIMYVAEKNLKSFDTVRKAYRTYGVRETELLP